MAEGKGGFGKIGIMIAVLVLFMLMIVTFGVVGLFIGAFLVLGGLWIAYGGSHKSSGILLALAGEPKWFVILVIVIIALIVAGLISLTWGPLGLLGMILLFVSFYILFLQRANIVLTLRNPFVIIFACAIVFLILSFSGIDSAYIVDLSAIPGFAELHTLGAS